MTREARKKKNRQQDICFRGEETSKSLLAWGYSKRQDERNRKCNARRQKA